MVLGKARALRVQTQVKEVWAAPLCGGSLGGEGMRLDDMKILGQESFQH